MYFKSLYIFLQFLNQKENWKKEKLEQYMGQIGPEALRRGHGPWPKMAYVARAFQRGRAHARRTHRDTAADRD
jgi:hypothetical protein